MTNNNQTNNEQNQASPTVGERASDLKERAGGLLQGGVEALKANPVAAAAVVGGVAAAAAAFVNRDKIVETAGALREKVGSPSSKNDTKA